MLVLASSQPPSPTDSYCPKRWFCPHSSLYCLCRLPVCTVSQLSYFTAKPHQTKESEVLLQWIKSVYFWGPAARRIWYLTMQRKEQRSSRCLVVWIIWVSWLRAVPKAFHLGYSPRCKLSKTYPVERPHSLCLSYVCFNVGSLGNILYFYAILLKETVKHKRINWFRKQISFIPMLIRAFVL